jgi:3-dehydroquinate dehydratase-2
MNILILHGPNLNLLGDRPGDERGRTFEALERAIRARAESLKVSVRTALSQSEGGLLEALHRDRAWAEAVVVNPTSLARTAWSLREALWALGKPVVEVQLEEGPKGEPSRRASVLREVCVRQILDEGMDGYLRALEHLSASPREKSIGRGARASGSHAALEPARKSIGRRAETEAEIPVGKTIGPRARTLVETEAPGTFTRELVRRKITERLAGRLSPADLASWAKEEWQQLQRGAHVDFPGRDLLESALQRLLLSNVGAARMSDEQLLELLTELSR